MSERGVFAVDRGLFDHPAFAKERFTEREAWIWLIKEAAWKDRAVRVGSAVVKLKRGECAHSIRFMADIWSWHRSKVERFINRLKIETLIETRTETGVTVVNICKYDEYQRVSLPRETPIETEPGTEPRQHRDKPEDIKNIKEKKERASAPPKTDEANFFEIGKSIVGEREGGTLKRLLKANGGSVPLAMAAVHTAQTKQNPKEYVWGVIRRKEAERADVIKPAGKVLPFDPISGGHKEAPKALMRGQSRWAI